MSAIKLLASSFGGWMIIVSTLMLSDGIILEHIPLINIPVGLSCLVLGTLIFQMGDK